MEIKHILAILVVLMLSGCAAKAPEQPGEAVTPEVTPPVEEQPPVEPEKNLKLLAEQKMSESLEGDLILRN